MMAAPARVLAQQNRNCCDYIVNTSNIPASCFPITVLTTWNGGIVATVTVTAPGFASFHVPFNCPPSPGFVSATVSGQCCLGVAPNFCTGCLFLDVNITC